MYFIGRTGIHAKMLFLLNIYIIIFIIIIKLTTIFRYESVDDD